MALLLVRYFWTHVGREHVLYLDQCDESMRLNGDGGESCNIAAKELGSSVWHASC